MENITAIRFVVDSSSENTRVRLVFKQGQLVDTNVNDF